MSSHIQSLSRACQHKISLAQAVLDTTAALKELIENALDAGATQIDVCIKGPSALDLLQVMDNGCGIDERDFLYVCKPSYTSKLHTFEELGSVRTLGFRGEALASLCLLGNVKLITKTAEAKRGSCLSFDHTGNVTKIETVARERGTTVVVTELFEAFPVRRESQKKATKRETTRMVDCIQQFALVSTGVRFALSIDGKRILKTQGHGSLLDSIAQLFSSMTVSSLIPMDTHQIQSFHDARITGFVSKPEKACARSATDRQYVFFRSRPIEMRKLCSLVTRIYQKQVGQNSYPLLFLYIELQDGTFDINIATDKRQLLIHDADRFLEACTSYFCELWKVKDYISIPECSQQRGIQNDDKLNLEHHDTVIEENHMQHKDIDRFRKMSNDSTTSCNCDINEYQTKSMEENHMDIQNNQVSKGGLMRTHEPNIVDESFRKPLAMKKQSGKSILEYAKRKRRESVDSCNIDTSHNIPKRLLSSEEISLCKTQVDKMDNHNNGKEPEGTQPIEHQQIGISSHVEKTNNCLSFHHTLYASKDHNQETNARDAEIELRQVLHKNDFLSMQMIGQFNEGFIIAKWHEHLFIIDQHAADERYHYEHLQKKQGELPCQLLIQPLTMPLSAEEEWLLINHMDWIEPWGFRFSVDTEKMPGNRISLLQVPFHEKTTFGIDDVLEMIHQLRNGEASSKEYVRFPKLEAAFASQACRMSIMIGTPLERLQMSRLVSKLAYLKDPWRCPHGRPTIRHLFTISNNR
ncbi:hypothetical protein GpartN1_g2792.t1 [Galdieria partita]|uniref:DNA mismatch repair protein PMS1 n=1 Tax=Galdieria partita TaxID=83374 RepID=A0A9C7PV71_9RHOD|nr:hypothetical protein GpartN1_g2792.t1 [Galdieria partita]